MDGIPSSGDTFARWDKEVTDSGMLRRMLERDEPLYCDDKMSHRTRDAMVQSSNSSFAVDRVPIRKHKSIVSRAVFIIYVLVLLPKSYRVGKHGIFVFSLIPFLCHND